MKLQHFGQIKEGKLIIPNQRRFRADLSQFKDCEVEIIIKKRGRRSIPQNAYYWGICLKEIVIQMREWGNDVTEDQLHEEFKKMFNPVMVKNTDGGEVLLEVGGTTTEMNKEEFSLFVDRVVQWAAEKLDLAIPSPGDQTALFLSQSDVKE